METAFEEVMSNAMKLSPRERVRLAQRLVASLDEQSDAGVEPLWAAEAARRLEELRTGRVQGIASAEAFRKAREALER